jgi:hypothetical protein
MTEGAENEAAPDRVVAGVGGRPRELLVEEKELTRARDALAAKRRRMRNSRGDEAMGSTWSYLDNTALGRQEEWEESPAGYPQTAPNQWWTTTTSTAGAPLDRKRRRRRSVSRTANGMAPSGGGRERCRRNMLVEPG